MPKNTPERIIDSQGGAGSGLTVVSGGLSRLPSHNILPDLAVGDAHPHYLNVARGDARYVLLTRQVIAGLGLLDGGALSADVTLNVGAGTLISVAADAVSLANGSAQYQVPVTGASPFTPAWTALSAFAGAGLAFSGGAFAVGAANTGATGLSVEADQLRLTSNSNPGAAAAVLASDASGYLNLVRLVLTDRLRSPLLDTVSGDMSIAPAGDLTIDPGGGEVFFQGADTIRSSTWTPGLLGVGWGIQERAAGKSHLDIRSIYTDELIATTFTADQVRVRMGSDWLSEALAIAARDNSDAKVTIPNVGGGSVRIFVENAPEVTGQIFDASEHVLIKTINRSSGLVIRETWGTVSSYQTETGNRQSYLWTTTSGGGNFALEPGTALVGFGVSGGSYIYRTVIEAGRGPYERFATWSTNPYTPANRVSRVEVGDIKNAAGDSTTRYGIAAGNNVALTPATGFSGFTSDSVYGMRMYNTLLQLYQSSTLAAEMTPTYGLGFLVYDSPSPADYVRQLAWWSNLSAKTTPVARAFGATYSTNNDYFELSVDRTGQNSNQILLNAYNGSLARIAQLQLVTYSIASGYSSIANLTAQNIMFSSTPRVGSTWGTATDVWHAGNTPKSVAGDRWGVMPFVDASGVMEVGAYIDFHYTDGDTSDYGLRLSAGGGYLACSTNFAAPYIQAANGGFLSDNPISFTNNAGSAYQQISSGNIWNYGGGYYGNGSASFLTTAAAAMQVRVGSVLSSSSYSHNDRVPTNGIYSLGSVHIGTSYGTSYALDVGGEVRVTGAIRTDTALSLLPVSTPAASTTYVILFLDSADGKLKYRLRSGDGGTVRTLSYT